VRFVCRTCATQFAESSEPPPSCPICEDERQYVGPGGQEWTTLEELAGGHRCDVREDAGYLGVGIEPSFAIGQRLLLAETPEGNVLWDMIPLVDDAAVAAVRARGDVRAIAISHPHYYSGMVEWSDALGGVPILLHEADSEWIMRPDPKVELWSGDVKELAGGLTLLRLGGHYPGGTVLHDANTSTLLSGDIVMVIPDRRFVSFMWSYPNLIPLPAAEVLRIAGVLEQWPFERILGAWWDRLVPRDGSEVVRRSAARYAARVTSPALLAGSARAPRRRARSATRSGSAALAPAADSPRRAPPVDSSGRARPRSGRAARGSPRTGGQASPSPPCGEI
jgi:glyoxylase-like metal-dependent hydrolase (beta-lactamase superfamily II)